MGLLASLLGYRAEGNPADERYWRPEASVVAASGAVVTAETAVKISAVFQAVRIIAETIGSLPLILYRRRPDGRGKDRAREHPLAPLLHDQPNEWQTAQEWREMMTGHAVLRGNAYAEIVPGPRGFADQLIPLHPDRVQPERIPGTMRLRYRYTTLDGEPRVLNQEQVFHLRGLGSDGFVGLSVLSLARESMGVWLAEESHSARFFSQAARPAGVLEHPGELGNEARERLQREWATAYSGTNAYKTAVLEEGMKWHELGIGPRDAQLLELRTFQVEDIARWFNIPVHMLMVGKQPTYASIEQFAIELVVYTFRPWLTRWEQAIQRDLVADDSGTLFAEFLLDALLRGDTQSRYEAYAKAIERGWMTRNEVRERENLNPLDGLDEPLTPLNMERGQERDRAPARPGPQRPADEERPAEEDEDDERDAERRRQRRRGALLRARLIASAAAERLVRKEIAAVTKTAARLSADRAGWATWLTEFYREHATTVAETMQIPPAAAREYADRHRTAVLAEGVSVVERWSTEAAPELVALAMEEEAHA